MTLIYGLGQINEGDTMCWFRVIEVSKSLTIIINYDGEKGFETENGERKKKDIDENRNIIEERKS